MRRLPGVPVGTRTGQIVPRPGDVTRSDVTPSDMTPSDMTMNGPVGMLMGHDSGCRSGERRRRERGRDQPGDKHQD